MLTWLRQRQAHRRQRLLAKKIAFSADADAKASADAMRKKTPTHQQGRTTGG